MLHRQLVVSCACEEVHLVESAVDMHIWRWTYHPFATQRWPIVTPSSTPGNNNYHPPGPSGTLLTDLSCHNVSSPVSRIASTPSPLSRLENLPTAIPRPEALAIITNPLHMRATETYQRPKQWQVQLQARSKPRSMVSGSHSIKQFGHSDMTQFIFKQSR